MKTGNLEGMSYESLREMARRRLPKGIFEYIDRGAEDETALAYNRRCFQRIRMRPKILVDVSVRTPEIELFGRKQALPLLVSPTAATGLVRHKGEIDLARAAAKANIPFCAATEAITAFEEVVAATKGNIWFQLYFWKDRRLSYGLVDRAREAGIDTLLVTVDTAVLPKREYNLRNGYDVPLRPSLRNLCDVATHPRWFVDVLLRYLLKGGMPRHGNYPEVYRRPVTGGKIADEINLDATVAWADIAELRRYWKGRLVIKGILRVEDALTAAAHGVDGVIVSNHGGRNFDSAVAPAEVLPEIAEKVGERLVILADSGIRRGSDVVKLLALGAKAVLVGRAFIYGTAVGGEAGAADAINMLGDEIDRTMAFLGCRSVQEIGPDLLWQR